MSNMEFKVALIRKQQLVEEIKQGK